jgi:ribosomal subunit interface protein
MQYKITGKQIDIGDALQEYVRENLGAGVVKYAERPTNATVIFSKSGAELVCEVTVHLSTGLTAAAKGHAHEIYAAFDAANEKMEKQLRRYKRRLKDHHNSRQNPVDVLGAPMYVLSVQEEDETESTQDTQPVIVAEMETKIPSLTVGEAVMQMELSGQPVLVFKNEGAKGVNVVYRRDDGHIGWIDPKPDA